MQGFPNCVAFYTLGFQAWAGFGGWNRSSPTGGTAKGMPRNVLTLVTADPSIGGAGITVPQMSPYLVRTVTPSVVSAPVSSKNVKMENIINNKSKTKDLSFILRSFKL